MDTYPGQVVRFLAFYQSATTGLGVTGLTVKIAINLSTGSASGLAVSDSVSASALDATNQPGVYYYDYTVPASYYGFILGAFTTTDTSVLQRGLRSLYFSTHQAEYEAQQYRNVSLVQVLGTSITESVGGRIAAAFSTMYNVASGVLTAESVNQTGDSYARIGAPAGASIAADIAALPAVSGISADLAAIQAKTDLISVASVPIATSNARTIRQGGSYKTSNGNALTAWTSASTVNLSGGTAIVRVNGQTWSSVTIGGSSGAWTFTPQLEEADTSALGRGSYPAELQVTVGGDVISDLVSGIVITVQRDA